MVQLIAFVIFIISLAAISLILYLKIPALMQLPQDGHHGIKKHKAIQKIEKKIRDKYFHFFEKQMLLHKVLSKSRIVIMKTERKIDELLHGIRKKAQQLDKETKKKK